MTSIIVVILFSEGALCMKDNFHGSIVSYIWRCWYNIELLTVKCKKHIRYCVVQENKRRQFNVYLLILLFCYAKTKSDI